MVWVGGNAELQHDPAPWVSMIINADTKPDIRCDMGQFVRNNLVPISLWFHEKQIGIDPNERTMWLDHRLSGVRPSEIEPEFGAADPCVPES